MSQLTLKMHRNIQHTTWIKFVQILTYPLSWISSIISLVNPTIVNVIIGVSFLNALIAAITSSFDLIFCLQHSFQSWQ